MAYASKMHVLSYEQTSLVHLTPPQRVVAGLTWIVKYIPEQYTEKQEASTGPLMIQVDL